MTSQEEVHLLVLGAGWLFQFLRPLLVKRNISFAATTTSGRDGTIKFTFPDDDDAKNQHGSAVDDAQEISMRTSNDVSTSPYEVLPPARAVLITFPVKGGDAMRRLIRGYEAVHPETESGRKAGRKWILLGSTGIYAAPTKDSTASTTISAPMTESMTGTAQVSSESQGPSQPQQPGSPPFSWFDENSPATPSPRYHAEQALLSLKPQHSTVLNLAGLFGEPTRDSRIWARAVPKTKEGVRGKGSVHFVHGKDVARVVLGVMEEGGEEGEMVSKGKQGDEDVVGKRFIVTDLTVYDWWDVIWRAAEGLEATLPGEAGERAEEGELTYRKWILEFMEEEGVRALPRPVEMLGRALDGRALWRRVGLVPGERRFGWPEREEEDAVEEKRGCKGDVRGV